MEARSDAAVLSAFAGGALLAGGNAVAIRFSNRELDPLWGASLRFVIATVVLIAIMAALGHAMPRATALRGGVVFGLLQFAGAFGLFYYALVHLHGGFGQTILALVPLVTLLLAVTQGQARLTLGAGIGTLLGLTGVAIMSGAAVQSVPPLALLAAIGSVLCFSQAAVVARRYRSVHPIVLNAVGMGVSAVVLTIASFVIGEAHALPTLAATWTAVAYVGVAGSVGVFLLYVYVIQSWGAARASYVMVVIPPVAIALSAWLDDEPVGWGLLVGGASVIAGVYVGALRKAAETSKAPSG